MFRKNSIYSKTTATILSILMIFSALTCLSSVAANAATSIHPTLNYCYNTTGDKITVAKTMCGKTAGSYFYRITVNGENVYCIEPGETLRSTSSLNDSSETWSSFDSTKQSAIMTALACGLEGNSSVIKTGTVNTDEAYIATQIIVYELVNDQRSTSAPYSLNSGCTGYIEMACGGNQNANILTAYKNIVAAMKDFSSVPSFTSTSASSAPTVTLQANYYEASDTWTYSTVTKNDDNGVLSSFNDFAGTYALGNSTVKVTKSDDSLTFSIVDGSVTGTTSSTKTLSSTKSGVPTCSGSVFNSYGGSSIQDLITCGQMYPVTAYFNIKVEVTTHSITRDGQIQLSAYTPSEWEDGTAEGEGTLSTTENVEGYYFYVNVSSDFKEYYGVDHIILGPTDEFGITQSLSDYVATYLDKNVSNNIPTGNYDVWELGKLKDGYDIDDILESGVTGSGLASYFYYPDNWAVADDANYIDGYTGTSSSRFSLRITASTSHISSTCYASNIYYIPLEVQVTNEDGSSAEGYSFQLVNNDTGTTYKIGPTDSDGYASLGKFTYTTGDVTKYIEEGTYTVTAISGSEDISDSYEVEISAAAYREAVASGYSAVHLDIVNTTDEEDTYILGDVDGDGNISVSDATAIQKFVVGTQSFTDEQFTAADVNEDGSVTVADATAIQKIVVGIA